MGEMNRRRWLERVGIIAAGSALPTPNLVGSSSRRRAPAKCGFDLSEFQPKSMLHGREQKWNGQNIR